MKDVTQVLANGLRYLRWGIGRIRFGRRKNSTAEKMLGMPQNPQRQVHALLARFLLTNNPACKDLLAFGLRQFYQLIDFA